MAKSVSIYHRTDKAGAFAEGIFWERAPGAAENNIQRGDGVPLPFGVNFNTGALRMDTVGAVATGPIFEFRKARGTAAAPTVATSGDDIGQIDFYGAVAADEYVRGAQIRADIAGTIATTRGPGTLTFLTATDAAPSVLTAAMVVTAAQAIEVPLGPVNIGEAGVTTGILNLDGATSGIVTLTVNDTAGTWVMTLPAAVGGAGEQLTDAGADGITSWASASSKREFKQGISQRYDADDALRMVAETPVYNFRYREGKGTGDLETEYVGVMADEAPWAMHYRGGIVNPVNTLGYMVLAFKALTKRLAVLEAAPA